MQTHKQWCALSSERAMRYISVMLNLRCCKCARMRFHCANDLVVLRSCAPWREHCWSVYTCCCYHNGQKLDVQAARPVCRHISGPVVSMCARRLAVLSNWLVHTAFVNDSAYRFACAKCTHSAFLCHFTVASHFSLPYETRARVSHRRKSGSAAHKSLSKPWDLNDVEKR